MQTDIASNYNLFSDYLKTNDQVFIFGRPTASFRSSRFYKLMTFTQFSGVNQAPRYEYVTENYYSYLSTNKYVVGTLKNQLNETVLLSIQKISFN